MLEKSLTIDLCRQWAAAELSGDAAALDRLATDDFLLIGPVGFVLERPAWLSRFGPDALMMEVLDWEPEHVRGYDGCTVIVGIQSQQATHAGSRADGRFRVTHVVVDNSGEPRLAAIQFSPLGGPGPFSR